MSRLIAQVAASIILILAVIAIMFGPAISTMEPSAEGFAFIGVITGAAAMFLFTSKTKNNGTVISNSD